ncbi:flagellar basal body P-ring protein FlgI [Sphingosinithalassobacter portus]|uniref:flagellar basal body P-ring protein FlgI n=1 Tax=Stakelama portus TaxID=2676234 RepID=UPI000D6E82E0|nr:flagellar basal body P-ring protein FlgI [Sphingosinithalassobacter portus]
MCLRYWRLLSLLCASTLLVPIPASAQDVPIKSLGRFAGWRDNVLVGYGLVTGLSGSGDSRRSLVTRRALRNILSRLGAGVTEDELSSRNVAAVLVTATLPPSANSGDRIDVTISSIGDARSLAGGTLILTPLLGPDQRTYALAQGSLVTGGYQFDSGYDREQRNYPTAATLPGGATIERDLDSRPTITDGALRFLLREPSFTTAERIAERISQRLGYGTATAVNADEIRIAYSGAESEIPAFISRVENLSVEPDSMPRIVINERTGTVVAGGDVTISSVVVAQGDIRVSVKAQSVASQPGYAVATGNGVASLIVTNTDVSVEEGVGDLAITLPSTTVADLVQALFRARVDTRRVIAVLQAIKAAGALHADIIIQ